MMSSAGRPSDEALLRKLDVSRLLVKPVKQSDLLNAITNALEVSMRENEGEGSASAAGRRTGPGLTECRPVRQDPGSANSRQAGPLQGTQSP